MTSKKIVSILLNVYFFQKNKIIITHFKKSIRMIVFVHQTLFINYSLCNNNDVTCIIAAPPYSHHIYINITITTRFALLQNENNKRKPKTVQISPYYYYH